MCGGTYSQNFVCNHTATFERNKILIVVAVLEVKRIGNIVDPEFKCSFGVANAQRQCNAFDFFAVVVNQRI